jgi:hypothetical protein
VKLLVKANNPREMILETWHILDYAVRDLTMRGLGLDKFCSDEFDLRYELFPEFRKLLQLLRIQSPTKPA